jgi:asparagine synthase (glutamine-hydrolysing)
MCGLAGFIDHHRSKPNLELCSVVGDMSETIRHRGPDDAGTWADEQHGIAFGFRRLAVLDLSEAGHQPQSSHDGRFVVVFNGEIYNHQSLRDEMAGSSSAPVWVGRSDTETLLTSFSAIGVLETMQRTVGMFALAVWDRQNRVLHLARDRFGEKPLYYGWTKQAFVFGSELQALRRFPGFDNVVDRDVLALYMQFAYVPAPYSIFKHIYKLQPGCLLTLPLADASQPPGEALFAPARHGNLRIERFWSLPDVARQGLQTTICNEDEAVDRVEAALSEAVQLQSIADVPLGALLSGGVDSSLIVALMQAHSSRRVKTFTIGFGESGFNEAEHAKAVAQHLGTEHEELYVTPDEARNVIPRLPDFYSEPFGDSSQIPTHLVSHMARRRVTVALSGDGGDELFGGYTRYVWGPRLWNGFRVVPKAMRRGLGAAIQSVPSSAWDRLGGLTPRAGFSRLGDKAHKLGHRLSVLDSVDDLYRQLVTNWPERARLVRDARPLPTILDNHEEVQGIQDAEHRMMLWDALTYLPDDILHKVDRASMAISLETRAPYLDHRVAALAWRLPLHMKIRGTTGKWILREVLYRHVPRELIERPKMGFGVPIGSWLRGPLRPWAEDLLDEKRLNAQGWLESTPLRRTWEEHLSGKADWSQELWPVLMFQAWVR